MKMKQAFIRKMKKTAIAAGVGAALSVGMAGHAMANIYGLSALDIDNLSVTIAPAGGSTPTSFNFNLTNTAVLNGVPDIEVGSCNGFPSNCGGAGAPLVLDALNASVGAAGGYVNNSMVYLGPNNTNYANSDSVIRDAQLVGDAFTDTDNLAEANLTDGGASASASSQIQSLTGFTFTFTLDATGSLTLAFDADPDMLALIDAFESGGNAQADLNTSFTLQQNTDNGGDGLLGFVNWNPQGTAANDCIAINGPTCTEVSDTQDLNVNVGTTTPGTSAAHPSSGGAAENATFGDALTAFRIDIAGLDAGTWTLTLNEVKSVNLTRDVPEPGILALLSIGLLGLGATSLRRKRV